VVGKYEIMRRLAVGGMAEIYLARVTGAAGFEKLVVLKRILPQVAEDPTFVQMFLDEARLAATLRHPNIADVYDVGEADGTSSSRWSTSTARTSRVIRHEAKQARRADSARDRARDRARRASALDTRTTRRRRRQARLGSCIATCRRAT
jgi:hypothetical protein